MTSPIRSGKLDRRTIIKAAAAAGVAQFAAPFAITARAADEIKFGLDDPLTGTYAELGKNEQIGCQLAVEQINAKGGILGRKAQLLVEDSTSADTGIAVQKARKLIERDKVDFLLGNVNSAMALALGQVSNELKTLHIVTGGHTDAVTGTDCHWNVFRVCNTTRMETNSVSKTAVQQIRQEMVLHHPRLRLRPYAAGRLRGEPQAVRRHRGRRRSDAARHDRLLVLSDPGAGGEPGRHHLPERRRRRGQLAEAGGAVRPRQALPYRRRAAGARGARGPAAGGAHRHLGVRMVLEAAGRAACQGVRRRHRRSTAARCRRRATGSATSRPGPAPSSPTRRRRSTRSSSPRRCEGFKLPPEIALMPNDPFYRAGDHQLMPTLFVGHAVDKGPEPGGSVQGRRSREGRRCRLAGGGDRLPAEMAGLSRG